MLSKHVPLLSNRLIYIDTNFKSLIIFSFTYLRFNPYPFLSCISSLFYISLTNNFEIKPEASDWSCGDLTFINPWERMMENWLTNCVNINNEQPSSAIFVSLSSRTQFSELGLCKDENLLSGVYLYIPVVNMCVSWYLIQETWK